MSERYNAFESNAMVEAFGIHARNPATFFYGKRMKEGALAEDYFDPPDQWWQLRGKTSPRLRDTALKDRVGEKVAHLSYRRTLLEEARGWNQFAIYCDLAEVMETFAGAVSESQVEDDFHENITAAMPPPTKPTRTPPHRPGGYSVSPTVVPTQGLRPSTPEDELDT